MYAQAYDIRNLIGAPKFSKRKLRLSSQNEYYITTYHFFDIPASIRRWDKGTAYTISDL